MADVIRGVKTQTLARGSGLLDSLEAAVVTIPVTFEGERRATPREAFSRTGIRIIQYVHEPLAALYGYLRSAADSMLVPGELWYKHELQYFDVRLQPDTDTS